MFYDAMYDDCNIYYDYCYYNNYYYMYEIMFMSTIMINNLCLSP